MTYGYARCSTNEERQDIDRQIKELKKMGVDDDTCIYFEYASGAKTDRPELQKLLAVVQPGDTIATTEVSRISRSTQQLCELVQMVQDKHLCLKIGSSFTVDCRDDDIDPMSKGMIMMWAVFAEMERDIITQRIRSGVENARAKGVTLGRPRVTPESLPSSFWRYYAKLQRGEITKAELARLCGVARSTVYLWLRVADESERPKKRRKS